ncbi:sigma factor [Streptomyces sp. NPDC054834]
MKTTADAETARPDAVADPGGEGCEEFVRDVYHHHGTTLLRYSAHLLNGDWHKAEDLLQEATVRAWARYGTAVTEPGSVRPTGTGLTLMLPPLSWSMVRLEPGNGENR